MLMRTLNQNVLQNDQTWSHLMTICICSLLALSSSNPPVIAKCWLFCNLIAWSVTHTCRFLTISFMLNKLNFTLLCFLKTHHCLTLVTSLGSILTMSASLASSHGQIITRVQYVGDRVVVCFHLCACMRMCLCICVFQHMPVLLKMSTKTLSILCSLNVSPCEDTFSAGESCSSR